MWYTIQTKAHNSCLGCMEYFTVMQFIRGAPKHRSNDKSCIYSYMFKLQSPSKCFPFDSINLLRHFFHCSKQFLNSLILIPFSASIIFCFTSSSLGKCLLLRTFFIQGNKKKSLGARLVNREVRHGGHYVFGEKMLSIQHGVSRYTGKSPIMKCADMLKGSSKKFTEAGDSLSQQCQLVHWLRWVSRTLT